MTSEEIPIPSSSTSIQLPESIHLRFISKPSNAPIQIQWPKGIAHLLSSSNHAKDKETSEETSEEALENLQLIWVKPKDESGAIKLFWGKISNFLVKYFGLFYTLIYGSWLSTLDLVTDIVVAFEFYFEDRNFAALLTIIFPIIATILVYRKKIIERDYKKMERIILPNYNDKWDKGFKFCENTPIPFIKSIYVRVFHSMLEWGCRDVPEKPIKLFDLAKYSSKLKRIETKFESVPEIMLQTILFFTDLKSNRSISDGRIISILTSVLKTSLTLGGIWISKLKYVFLGEDKYWGYFGKFLFYLESSTLIVLRVATVNVIFYWFSDVIILSEYFLDYFLVIIWLLIPRVVFTLSMYFYTSRNFEEKFYFYLRKQHFHSICSKWLTSIFFYQIQIFQHLCIFAYVHFEHIFASFIFFFTSLYPKFSVNLGILWGAYALSIAFRLLFVKLIFDSPSRSFLTGINIVKNCEKALDEIYKSGHQDNIHFKKIMDATRDLSNSIIEADKKNHCLSFQPEYKENELHNHMEYNILTFNLEESPGNREIYNKAIEIILEKDIPSKPAMDFRENLAGKINENPKKKFASSHFSKVKNEQFLNFEVNKQQFDKDIDQIKCSHLKSATHNFTVPAKKLLEYSKTNKPRLSDTQMRSLGFYLLQKNTKIKEKLPREQLTRLMVYCTLNLYPFSEVNQKESKFYQKALEKLEIQESDPESENQKKKELIYFLWLNFFQFSDLCINNFLYYCSKEIPYINDQYKWDLVQFIKKDLPKWTKMDLRWIFKYFKEGYLKLSQDQIKNIINYHSEHFTIEGIEDLASDTAYQADVPYMYNELKLWNKARINNLINFCNNCGPYPYNNAYKKLKEIYPLSTESERSHYIQLCQKVGIKTYTSEKLGEDGVDLVINEIQLNALIKLTYLKIFYTTTSYLEILKRRSRSSETSSETLTISEEEKVYFEQGKKFLTSQLDFILSHDLMSYESLELVVPLHTFSSFKFKIGSRFENLFDTRKNFKDLMRFYNVPNYKYTDIQLEDFWKTWEFVESHSSNDIPITNTVRLEHIVKSQFTDFTEFTISQMIDLELKHQVTVHELYTRQKEYKRLEHDYKHLIETQLKFQFEIQNELKTIPIREIEIDMELKDSVSGSERQVQLVREMYRLMWRKTEIGRELKAQPERERKCKRELRESSEFLKSQPLIFLENYIKDKMPHELNLDICNFKNFLELYLYVKEDIEKNLELGETSLDFIDEETEWKENGEYLKNLPFKYITANKPSWFQNLEHRIRVQKRKPNSLLPI